MNEKALFEELKKVHKIKKRQFRKPHRNHKPFKNQSERETFLYQGAIWTVLDKSIPFDRKRKEKDIKNASRPTLVLETPENFGDSDLVWLAPGTTKKHNPKKYNSIVAKVPPEALKKTTWFLLKYSWWGVQKNLVKRIGELSPRLKDKLQTLLRKYYE